VLHPQKARQLLWVPVHAAGGCGEVCAGHPARAWRGV